MNNIQLLNICYKFFNRFITAEELVKQLSNIDKSELTKEDIEETKKLIEDIKVIIDNVPNEIDELVIRKKEMIKNMIMKFENIPKDEDNEEFLNRQLKNLNNSYNQEMDSYERWFKVTDCINKNIYFNKCFDNLSSYELLNFIAQNIQAPFPPQLTQEKFEKLVQVGIENDKREWLWRLAFNYENKGIKFDSIVDYFIKVKDGYYLSELICVVSKDLDIDNIIDKLNDKKLIEDLIKRKNFFSSLISKKQLDKLIEKNEN